MKLHFTLRIIPVSKGLGVEAERVPRVETERAMLGPLLGQGVETEREHAKNVTSVPLWRGSKPNAGGSKPKAWSISRGSRSTFDDVLWCFPVWLCPLQRHGSIYFVYLTGVAMWTGSKLNAVRSKPKAWSISRGRRSTVALSLANFDDILLCLPEWLFDIIPCMYT